MVFWENFMLFAATDFSLVFIGLLVMLFAAAVIGWLFRANRGPAPLNKPKPFAGMDIPAIRQRLHGAYGAGYIRPSVDPVEEFQLILAFLETLDGNREPLLSLAKEAVKTGVWPELAAYGTPLWKERREAIDYVCRRFAVLRPETSAAETVVA